MELLLGEHGEALLYGIIGVIMVLLVCSICAGNWKKIMPEYKTISSKDSGEFIAGNSNKFPIIDADEIIFADYKDEKFDYRDFIVAKDYKGRDISENMKVYGNVDIFQKGLYQLRCVVVAENNLACTKYVNVLVE